MALFLFSFIIITIIEHWKDITWRVYFWLSGLRARNEF